MRTFFVLSLPRCRTAWLANFLTYGESYCFHEGLIGCRKAADLAEKFASTGKQIVGNADCGNVLFLDELKRVFPESRLVIIDRNLDDVLESLVGMDGEFHNTERVERAAAALEWAKAHHDALTIDYDDLNEQGCRKIMEHCTGQPFDLNRWKMLDGMDIQIDGWKKTEEMYDSRREINELMAGV